MSKASERIDRAFIKRQHAIRMAILGELYARGFHERCFGAFFRDLVRASGQEPTECERALDYLTDIGHVKSSDRFYEITASGMQFFEKEFQ